MMKRISVKFMLAAICIAAPFFTTTVQAAPANWSLTFSETPGGGYIVGNPAARNHVVEFASYTCSHCAEFEANEAPSLKSSYVASGKARFEIRALVRDPVDLTLAMLARCGGKGRFFGNHKFLMANQQAILNKADQISAANQAKLKAKDIHGFMLGAYTDMGLAALVSQRGITGPQARICLSDKGALQKILGMGEEASSKYPIKGTPAFVVNGKYAEVQPSVSALSALFIK
jgi:protein-disulfide isomerase